MNKKIKSEMKKKVVLPSSVIINGRYAFFTGLSLAQFFYHLPSREQLLYLKPQ